MSPGALWLFDIDGVLTDYVSRQVSDELIAIIARINHTGAPVAFVTGRSFSWFEKRILRLFDKHGGIDLSKIYCSCEKGGVSIRFKDNLATIVLNKNLKIPTLYQHLVKALVSKEFTGTMVYDPKLTMATVEAREDVANDEFRQQQIILDAKLQLMIEDHKHTKTLKIDSAAIATDLQSIDANKSVGAVDVLGWLTQNLFIPEQVYTFGDTLGDLEVPKLLHSAGYPVTCVFTGGLNSLKKKSYPFKLISTNKLFDKGAVGFFHERFPVYT